MALDSGSHLGPYEIVGLIGLGGMGEVYRARDTKLGRDVALKTLPSELATDESRLVRFEREAQLLATLNHPNVAQIYGLEQAGGTTAIVMELVDGATLAARLATGAIPTDEALEIAFQLADALEAAHERGIVHRDLKPANIAVRPDGRVKVLDFGIAKVLAEVAHGARPLEPTSLPTQVTRPGFAIGTTAYMSPEQARGKPVDQRTDIWAFGCILYEMLTGQPAFRGEDDTSTLARVLERDTDLSALPAAIPDAVHKALRVCLVKDPRERVADIRDVRLLLKGTFDEAPGRSIPPFGWIAAALAAAAVAAVAAWNLKPGGSSVAVGTAAAPVVRAQIDLPAGQHLSTGYRNDDVGGLQRPSRSTMALSPDGKRLAYTAGDGSGSRLYVRRLDEREANVVAGTEGASQPFFSPDSASIGFFVGTQIKRVAIAGGEPRTIAISQSELLTFDWREAVWTDSDTLLVTTEKGIYEVPASGGQLVPLTELKGDERLHLHPQLLPGRRGLLYNVATDNTEAVPSNWAIVVQPLGGGEPRVIDRGSDPRYLPTSHIVFARQGALLAAPFDAGLLERTGASTIVIENVMQAEGGINSLLNTGTAQFAFSREGSLAYVAGGIYPEVRSWRIVWVDLAGNEIDLGLPSGPYLFPRVSPDGKRLSYVAGRFGDSQIWIYDLAVGIPSALTRTGQHHGLSWSPDSSRLVFARPDLGGRMFTIGVDGGTAPQPIGDDLRGYPLSWSRDNVLAFGLSQNAPGLNGLWTLRLDGTSKPEQFVEGTIGFAQFSPDGKWLAYVVAEGDRGEVYVRPYPAGTPVYRISPAGGLAPVWSPDGKQLFYVNTYTSPSKHMVVDMTTEGPSRPRELFSSSFSVGAPERDIDIAPDGRRFIALAPAPKPANEPVTSVELVLNWFNELNALVPVPQR